ncbi:amidohydrolase family protein [Sessilibacter corallicola]|uniref:amidohydrolase family protein n=1 Tax=Sessilibacter corallicola TaxID=2904075 RepID=UPI001E37081E|nr:amidohydrolase family protein [Sessilibacter corallicola]MCE2029019.1 amidohydrolase [Sessilibacter corallicola]
MFNEAQKIHDCDRHLIEPNKVWSEYVATKYYKRSPVELRLALQKGITPSAGSKTNTSEYFIAGKPVLDNWTDTLLSGTRDQSDELADNLHQTISGSSQLTSMDKSGIYSASIFPTFTGYIVNHNAVDSETSIAYAQGYNNWLEDYCDADKNRLIPVGVISRHDPSTMVNQLETILEKGWKNITLRPEPIQGLTLGDPSYEHFWQCCAEHNVSVSLHGGTHLAQPDVAGKQRFNTRFAMHACSHPMEIQMAFLSLLDSGVLEKNPTLKIAFLEAGASWLPSWLWRLDNICYPEFPSLIKNHITMLPSEYFKRNCWITIEIGEPCLDEVIKIIGVEKLLYGSDFPHMDHIQFDLNGNLTEKFQLKEEEISIILNQNATNFFTI